MTEPPILYTNPMSRGRMVRWVLEEIGCPYQTQVVAYGPDMKAPAYLAINPMGKVPALVHRGTTFTETPAICAYLADAFPEAGLAPPPGSPERGTYYRWLFFGAGPVETAIIDKITGARIPADKQGFSGYGSLDTLLTVLEQAVSARDYLVGDRFSVADIYLCSELDFGMMFGCFEKRPAFLAYSERLRARPAAVRARSLDDALIPPPA